MKAIGRLISTLQIDTRLLGMVAALIVIWAGFDLLTDGRFLTPRNLFNLSVQTASVAVMATGMVFVIVTRHIDLSLGSLLGLIGMIVGSAQVHWLPQIMSADSGMIWILSCVIGLVVGAGIGAFQGWIIGFMAVPAFIVTLGGLLIWRGAAWWVTSGQTVAPLDKTYRLLGGGAEGTLGNTMSWIAALAACIAATIMLFWSRRTKIQHAIAVKPLWAECALAALFSAGILGFAAVMTAYEVPKRAAERIYKAKGLAIPEGGIEMVHGIAIPVVIVVVTAIVMTIIARRTRFGRYIFAAGGNPDAAELSGIDTRFLTVKVFALMGGLTAIAAIIASARLGSVGNDLGTLDELRVIAAAVIGGTALSGGIGTIHGAILGAVLMQSLQSGMAMVGVDAPLQSIVVGVVLVVAVLIDSYYRRKAGV